MSKGFCVGHRHLPHHTYPLSSGAWTDYLNRRYGTYNKLVESNNLLRVKFKKDQRHHPKNF